MKYFVEKNPNYGAVNRYHILRGNTVVEITASRPDGEEVLPPPGVEWEVRKPDLTAVSVRRIEFHNVPEEVADAARKNAGEKQRRRVGWNNGKKQA